MAAGSTAYSPFSVSRKEQAVTLTRKTANEKKTNRERSLSLYEQSFIILDAVMGYHTTQEERAPIRLLR